MPRKTAAFQDVARRAPKQERALHKIALIFEATMRRCFTDTIVQYDVRLLWPNLPQRLPGSEVEDEKFIDHAWRACHGSDTAGGSGGKEYSHLHGAVADGSGWRRIGTILERDGYTVYVVQEPLTSWDADLAATRKVLDRAGQKNG